MVKEASDLGDDWWLRMCGSHRPSTTAAAYAPALRPVFDSMGLEPNAVFPLALDVVHQRIGAPDQRVRIDGLRTVFMSVERDPNARADVHRFALDFGDALKVEQDPFA
jgi:hypothetical protein